MTLELLPYQQQIALDRTPTKFVVHGRRIGATVAAARRAVQQEALMPDRTLYVAPTQTTAFVFGEYCLKQARELGVAIAQQSVPGGVALSVGARGRIIAMGASGQQTLQQLRGHRSRIILDQAAYIPGFLSLYQAISMYPDVLIMSDWAKETEPTERPNPFNTIVKKLRWQLRRTTAPKGIALSVIDMDTALHDGLYRQLCQANKWEWSRAAEQQWRNDLIAAYGASASHALFCGMPESGLIDQMVVG